MIPEEKSAAVARALREVFGDAEMSDIQRVTKGMSSDLVFRIVVKGSPYLLRVIPRITVQTDPSRHFTCMGIAAEAGVAPRVWYASIEDGVSIIDFVEALPLSIAEARARVPLTLRRLHAIGQPFPKPFNYATAHRLFIWRFRAADFVPASEVAEVLERYEQLCAVYPRLEADMVPSHMDLKPENIVFDGARIWLVDWQAAFMNDRYFDLAVAANFVIRTDADERAYLDAYFGRPADEYERARFFRMRQFLHLLASAVYLILAQPAAHSGDVPEFHDFLDRVWAGEINLADKSHMALYGQVHWARLLENVRLPRFDESLRIVSVHPSAEGADRLFPIAE